MSHVTSLEESDNRSKDKKNTSIKKAFLVFALILQIVNLIIFIVGLVVTRLLFKQVKKNSEVTEEKEEMAALDIAITHNQEKPPLTMGPERLHYIYATSLPQTYLTLLSVLQGLVFGVLLLRIPLPPNTSLLGIFSFLLQEYLYLPYIISSLIILIVWNQFVHGILFLAWPFTVFQSSLIFLMSLVEILTVTSVNFLPAWLFGVGWIAIVGAFIRFNNIRYLPKDKQIWIAPLNNYPIFSKKTEVSDGLLYMGMGIIVLIISVIFNSIIDSVSRYNNSFPSIIKLGILVLLFIMAIGILLIDKKNRRIYLDIFVKGSDLAVTPHGIISYLKGVEKDT